jgi:hypothetical protein
MAREAPRVFSRDGPWPEVGPSAGPLGLAGWLAGFPFFLFLKLFYVVSLLLVLKAIF